MLHLARFGADEKSLVLELVVHFAGLAALHAGLLLEVVGPKMRREVLLVTRRRANEVHGLVELVSAGHRMERGWCLGVVERESVIECIARGSTHTHTRTAHTCAQQPQCHNKNSTDDTTTNTA